MDQGGKGGLLDWSRGCFVRCTAYPISVSPSETRLLEVLEGVCSATDFGCHQLLEQSEEHVERWWFHE